MQSNGVTPMADVSSRLELLPPFFDDPQELVGGRIDGVYELTSVIGGGATAIVYAARHLVLGKRVAVKLLHPTLATLPEMRQRFLREASAAASVDHPGLVRVTDARVSVEGYHYLVMEHLSGRDLATWSASNRPMSLADMASVGAQVADALAALHGVGLVHRDLKPENLIVMDPEPHRADLRIKVIDLGIVAKMSEDVGSSRLTRADVTLGTVFYMSPEQATGASVDGRADIYALGCVLWELAVGRPFVGDGSPSEVLARQVGAIPDPPSRHRADLPRWFDELVLQCLAKKPEQRIQSAAEVAERFREATLPVAEEDPRGWGWWALAATAILGLGLGWFASETQRGGGAVEVEVAALMAQASPERAPVAPWRVAPEAEAAVDLDVLDDKPMIEEVHLDQGAPEPAAAQGVPAPVDAVAQVAPGTATGSVPEAVEGVAPREREEVPVARELREDRRPRPGPGRERVRPAERQPEEREVAEGPRRVRLTFAVEPAGAVVHRNGVVLGRTPLSLEVEALDSTVAYEVSHPERVTLKLVYPSEVDRVVSRSLPRLEGEPVSSRSTARPQPPTTRAPTENDELWRPARPTEPKANP